jgi:peptide deformylase
MNLVSSNHPALWRVATPVTDFSVIDGADGLGNQMISLAIKSGGIGLAAPQVGLSLRLFVMRSDTGWRICANPSIIGHNGIMEPEYEGCLSFPKRHQVVTRPSRIYAEWQREDGKTIRRGYSGMDARVFQHELDHLNGVCIFPKP